MDRPTHCPSHSDKQEFDIGLEHLSERPPKVSLQAFGCNFGCKYSIQGTMSSSKNRGELGEIRASLAALSSASSTKPDAVVAKKDLFRKIVNYMTIGIDMSSLFMQVINCAVANSEDVQLKKMLYHYIGTYAQSNPDLTLLTINLLTKDCRDQDPTIRGLALRSLCGLRVANLLEYLVRNGFPFTQKSSELIMCAFAALGIS